MCTGLSFGVLGVRADHGLTRLWVLYIHTLFRIHQKDGRGDLYARLGDIVTAIPAFSYRGAANIVMPCYSLLNLKAVAQETRKSNL